MPIDKTIPNKLQTDLDQRGVNPRAGEMLDAQNVTMSESGRNSAGVIKNVRGTVAATADSNDRVIDGDSLRVIGSVSDAQRGYIYWFVADRFGSSQHAIYRQDTNSNTYQVVLKTSALNFRPTDFVKADIINAAFQQDDSIQTALFFTDNFNPPRKINVDRAIAGDYDGITLSSADHNLSDTISTVKAAETRNPTFYFSTDTDIQANKFTNSAYQFATQYVYRDGEVSAISPYSPLAVSTAAALRNQEGTDAPSLAPYTDNVCEVFLNINPNLPDMSEVRLLAREGNTGPFFVVEQFDPNEDVSRNIYGSNKDVYNAASQVYRFYNDRNGALISQFETNKLYDNVPFLAAGQSIDGGRLVYSNYTEGRANLDVTNPASFTVNYESVSLNGRAVMNTSDHSSDTLTQEGDIDVLIDLLATSGPLDGLLNSGSASATTAVPVGSVINIGFDFSPTLTLSKSGGGNLVEADLVQFDDLTNQSYTGSATYTQLVLDTVAANSSNHSVLINLTTSTDTTVSGLATRIANELEEINDVVVVYNIDSTASTSVSGTINGPVNISGKVAVHYNFENFGQSGGNSTVSIKPNITRIDFSETTFSASSYDTFLATGQTDVLIGSPTQAQFSFTNVGATYVTDKRTELSIVSVNPSFKAGCSHSFGIVFYDRFNRSGNVQDLGSVYIDSLPERTSGGYGPASVRINLSDALASAAPDWAVRYQIVYPGRSSIGDFTQYTVGGGYRALKKNSSGDYTGSVVDSNSKRIYVSLKNLDMYQEEKGASRSYSFTKGDKLRVIKGRNSDDSADEYYSASDGTIIEFDVVGVEVLDGTSGKNPIEATAINSEHIGTFVVLESPSTNSGALGTDGNDLTYTGFDWDDMGTNNYWDRNIVVEIYSPKSEQENRVYYEIGHGGRVGDRKDDGVNDLGDSITVTNGDVFVRPVACKSVHYSSAWKADEPENWTYETKALESSTWTDAKEVTDWNRGRPHVIFEDAAQIRRRNGLTYSDAYAEDVEVFSLSSFNASLANFFSLDAVNGACNYIESMRDGYMIAIQENSVSRIPVGKNIITSADQSGLVSLTTNFLGEPFYYIGDYGCGNNPESVLVKDGSAFFVDASRKKVVRLTGEGLSPVSESGVDSLFKDEYDAFAAQGGTRMVSGFDPEDGVYYITLRPSGTYNGLTLGYNISGGMWQSRYSFIPDMYSDQNGTMYSALYVDPSDADATLFHAHTNETTRNTFYGTAYPAVVRTVSNYNPSLPKVFNAISLEGDSASWVADPVDTSLGGSGQSKSFVEKEGSYYSEFTRDENGTKHMMGIGEVDSVDGVNTTVTFINKVNRNPIPYGSIIRMQGNSNGLGSFARELRFKRFVDAYTIEGYFDEPNTFINTTIDYTDVSLIAMSDATVDGDPLRGHWADITLTNNQTAPFELFCINTHFSPSDQNHSLGQQ